MQQETRSTSPAPNASLVHEADVDPDHLCPICQVLLYRPVRTRCNHVLCEACMAHWADVSISTQMTTVGLDDVPLVLLPNDIETRCPMCRTPTTASLDVPLDSALQLQYPVAYQERETESSTTVDDSSTSVETLTLYIGNEHSLIRANSDSNNKHQWNFFIRPSRTDLVEEVQIFLVSWVWSHLIMVHQPHHVASYVSQPSNHCPKPSL